MIDNTHIHWSPGVTIWEAERQCILQALHFFRNNKTQTAQCLGVSIRTIDNKLEEYAAHDKRTAETDEFERKKRENFLARCRGLPEPHKLPPADLGFVKLGVYADQETKRESSGSPAPGIHVEPVKDTPAQQTVPLLKREEVQKVLSKQPAAGGGQKNR